MYSFLRRRRSKSIRCRLDENTVCSRCERSERFEMSRAREREEQRERERERVNGK